ncbi:MAG: 50S ribosomal protein L25 [bacterium]|nr:50S ribosomal protein L25 [bacterium]
MFTIKATKRDEAVKLDTLRKGGEIPAVYYGKGSKTSNSISIPAVEFKKIWAKAGESSAVQINTEKGNVDALIHEVQRHPITGEPIHVDFLVIDMNKKITVSVPVEFEGVSQAVKSGLGSLVKVLHEVEIEALPKDLPHNLMVDISKLVTVEDNVFVSDIVLPKGVTLVTKDTEVLGAIAVAKEEVEETTPVDLSAIEVEKKGKKEEEAPAAE